MAKLARTAKIIEQATENGNVTRHLFIDNDEFPWYTIKGSVNIVSDEDGFEIIELKIPVVPN